GLDRRSAGGPGATARHQAGRRRPDPHLPGPRGRRGPGVSPAVPGGDGAGGAGTASEALYQRARQVIPGGVSSPVRAFGSVGGAPYFVARAEGPYVWDADGRRLIDLVQSYGAIILGHAHPAVVEAVARAAADGTSYGAP